jgi:hypothetical protein
MYNGWRCWSQLPGLTSRRAWGREHGAGLFNTREAPHTPGRGRQPAAQAAGGGMGGAPWGRGMRHPLPDITVKILRNTP